MSPAPSLSCHIELAISRILPKTPWPFIAPHIAATRRIFQSTLDPLGILNNLLGLLASLIPNAIENPAFLIKLPIPAVVAANAPSAANKADNFPEIWGNFFVNASFAKLNAFLNIFLEPLSMPLVAPFLDAKLVNLEDNVSKTFWRIFITLLSNPPFSADFAAAFLATSIPLRPTAFTSLPALLFANLLAPDLATSTPLFFADVARFLIPWPALAFNDLAPSLTTLTSSVFASWATPLSNLLYLALFQRCLIEFFSNASESFLTKLIAALVFINFLTGIKSVFIFVPVVESVLWVSSFNRSPPISPFLRSLTESSISSVVSLNPVLPFVWLLVVPSFVK